LKDYICDDDSPQRFALAESVNPVAQSRKYNGKEWIEAHGLDEYDSQARMYYPAIMRTTTLDPLAEKYYSISPYAWCGNNPVRNVDPDGRMIGDYYGRDGMYLGTDEIDDDKIYVLNEGRAANLDNKDVNWGGALKDKHVTEIKANSTELELNSDEGELARIIFAEARGENKISKEAVADVVKTELNRANSQILMKVLYIKIRIFFTSS